MLDDHVQPILGLDFSPNGYQLATGSGDDTIRIWDMRASKALQTIPAHTSSVSDVRFYKSHGTYLSRSGDGVDSSQRVLTDELGELIPGTKRSEH